MSAAWIVAAIFVAIVLLRVAVYQKLRTPAQEPAEEDFRIIEVRKDRNRWRIFVEDADGERRYIWIKNATAVWVAIDPDCREVALRLPRGERSRCAYESAKIVVPDKAQESEWIRRLNDACEGGVA